MPDVTVHRHGDRWAVTTSESASALREFETREAAESSARLLAEGGKVEVLDEDPTSLGGSQDGVDPAGTATRPADELTDDEHIRSEQGGL